MAMPDSGNPISISQIKTEMGSDDGSLTNLSTTSVNAASSAKPDGSAPHSLSEFYSYDHAASAGLTELALFGPGRGAEGNCEQSPDTNFYHDGGGSPYANGVIYYQTDDDTGPVADEGFYGYSAEAGISINRSGEVVGTYDC